MPSRPLAVHYCHGLESGPHGFKVRKLRETFTVTAPDMQMSLWNPLQHNSVVRNVLRLRWPSAALGDSFAACVAVHQRALADAATPDVLVGSSWGGAVAAALVAVGAWRGPVVLMCPALQIRESRMGELCLADRPHLTTAAITSQLAALPAPLKAQCVLVHGTNDCTVPIDDSRSLAAATGIALIEVEGAEHGLGAWTSSGELRAAIERVSRKASG
jgi:pimeloyl-ACP methyl ester carboxylesterase